MTGAHTRLFQSNLPPKFAKQQTLETAETLTEAKHVANNISDSERYPFRARAVLVGNALVRPYDPIYLENLPNGMSGYWTVLEVTHDFGGPLRYVMRLLLGADPDTLGVTGPTTEEPVRNIAGELTGSALDAPTSTALVDYSSAFSFEAEYATPAPVVDGALRVVNIYGDQAPDFGSLRNNITWSAI